MDNKKRSQLDQICMFYLIFSNIDITIIELTLTIVPIFNKKMLKVDSIVDQTRKDLEVIRSTGTHHDSKVLAELRKRKLCDKQFSNNSQNII